MYCEPLLFILNFVATVHRSNINSWNKSK